MPELPDLAVFSRNLNNRITDKKIVSFSLFKPKQSNIDEEKFRENVEGKTLIKTEQIGKELYFILSENTLFSVHLMLNGKLQVTQKPEAIDFKIASLELDNGMHLVLRDEMSWAKIMCPPPSSPAPDALKGTVDFHFLKQQLQTFGRKTIKAFLLDQKVIKGIGNAYADEILWHCKISPESKCGKIPDNAIEELAGSIKTVLENAIEQIIRISPERISGEERSFLVVHRKDKKTTEGGEPILMKKVASKKTYYTDKQVLYT